MTDDVTHLRALLADATARAEKAEAERDAALAANAELRAAGLVAHDHACKMAEFHGPRCEEHERHDEAPDDCLRCAADTAFGLAFAELRKALARPDLGRGMVVEREVLERSGGRIKAALDDIYETWVNADEGGARTCDEATVGALKAVLVDLDALLKKGGG